MKESVLCTMGIHRVADIMVFYPLCLVKSYLTEVLGNEFTYVTAARNPALCWISTVLNAMSHNRWNNSAVYVQKYD